MLDLLDVDFSSWGRGAGNQGFAAAGMHLESTTCEKHGEVKQVQQPRWLLTDAWNA